MERRWWRQVVLGCAVLAPMMEGWCTDEPADKQPPTSAVTAEAAAEGTSRPNVDGSAKSHDPRQQPDRYWIGVSCEPVSDSLRTQLDLAEGLGLLVSAVMDDSPAQAAGVMLYDVLISAAVSGEGKAEERPLAAIDQLSDMVQKAGTKPLKLALFRKGKPLSLEVTPTERPQQDHLIARLVDVNLTRPPGGNPERVQGLLRQLQEEIGGGPQGVRLQIATPVVVTAPPLGVAPLAATLNLAARVVRHALPDGMTLTITKSGDKPARIEVRKGEGQVWGATETEIGTLPQEAQALARAAIAGMSQAHLYSGVTALHAIHSMSYDGLVGGAGSPLAVSQPIPPEKLKELAELHRQLAADLTVKGVEHPDVKRIRERIDALHRSLPKAAVPQTAPATTKSVRTTVEQHSVSEKPVPAAVQSTVDSMAQMQRLEQQVQELVRMLARQAEAQQQQLRELQQAIEKLSPKE